MKYRIAKNKDGEEIRVPVFDVRASENERRAVAYVVKTSNGNQSKFIPAKYGYGPFGPKKY